MRVQLRLRLSVRLAVGSVTLLAAALASGWGAASVSHGARLKTVPLLRIGIVHPVNTLDIAKDTSSLPYVGAMGLEPLLSVAPNGKIIGVLATGFNVVGRDLYIFNLRHNVHFWDGNLMTSADVANALNYYRAPGSQLAFYFSSVKSIVAQGQYTVAIRLRHPDSSVPFNLATSLVPIFEKSFQDAHKATMGQPGTLIEGTGPWKIDSLDPTSGAEMSVWSGYWGPKPLIQHLSFKFFSDVTSMALAFRARAIDLVPEINDAVSWKATTGQAPVEVPGCQEQSFFMPTSTPPWNDVHVRRAVAYAMNRLEQIQAHGVPATPITTLVIPTQLYRIAPKATVDAMIKSLPQYPLNLTKAKAELAKSAYPHGFTGNFPTVTQFFGNDPQVVANELSKIGIHLNVQNIPFSDWIDHIINKRDIPGLTYTNCLTGDPHDFVTNDLVGGRLTNYNPPALKPLIQQSTYYSNPAKRFAVYTKLLRLLATDLPYIPLFDQDAVMAISSKFKWPSFNPSWLENDYVAQIVPK